MPNTPPKPVSENPPADDIFSWKNRNKIVPSASMKKLVELSKLPCSCCGVKSALNPHRMDNHKVKLMRDLAIMLRTNAWVRVEQGNRIIGLDDNKLVATSYCACAHICRLAYFGLAESQGPRTSNWRLTADGFLFLRGRASVPFRLLCRSGEVVYESEERCFIGHIKETFDKEYWDNYPWVETEARKSEATP